MARTQVNLLNLSKSDYRGANTTLCQGCGHNSISSQIIAACYELNIAPEEIVKFSGIETIYEQELLLVTKSPFNFIVTS